MARVYKGAGIAAAKIAGRDPEMDKAAERVHGAVRSSAEENRSSGDFVRSIKTKKDRHKSGVLDRVVFSDDPAAFEIEFGWVQGGRSHPGQHHFSNTYRRLR